MARSFETVNVKIIDRPFFRSDGYSTQKSAKISIYNSRGKLIEDYELGVPQLKDIYDAIGQGATVNLDQCYIKGFSLTACRRFLLKGKADNLTIYNFSAKNAFFESAIDTDFTHATFEGELLAFTGTTFHGGGLSFNNSILKCSKTLFDELFIKTEQFSMAQCLFSTEILTFKNSVFGAGTKDFQDTDFGNGHICFINTDFGTGDVLFVNTRFNDSEVSFKVARFGDGRCDFRYSRFGSKTVIFDQADFCVGHIDFRNVDFGSGKTSFNRCIFPEGIVNFDGAVVKNGKVSFIKSVLGAKEVSFEYFQALGSDLIFDRVVFPGIISFYNGIFDSLILTYCQFNGTANLHVEKAKAIDLSGCIARDIVDFYSHGEPPKVDLINFSGFRLLGRFYVQWNVNNMKSAIYEQTNTTWAEKADQFRVLKQNFSVLGRYDDEDLAYVELMRCRSRHSLIEGKKGSAYKRILAYASYYFKLLVFDWMGLYATSPQRVIISIVAIIMFFSTLYTIFSLTGIGDVVASSDLAADPGLFFRSMYICIITFFTIGYGEFIPLGYSRIISSALGFFGVFLMSYFTVAFVRKILR